MRLIVLMRRIRRFLLTTVLGGIAVVLPITIFVVLIRSVVRFTSKILSPMRQLFPFSNDISIWLVDLISLTLVILVFFFIGLFVQTRFGNRFFKNLEDRWLMHLPFYSILREMVQQFFGSKKTPFSQVVLIDAFGSGVLMTGFISDDAPHEDFVTVFVPTGPNPTNGFVFHSQKDRLQYLDVRPEDAMRTIIGVGTGSKVLFEEAAEEE